MLGLTGGALVVGAGILLGALVGGSGTAAGVWVLWLTAPTSAGVAAGTTARLGGSSAGWAVGLALVALLGGVFLSGLADYGTLVTAVTSAGGDPVSLLWRRFLGIAVVSVFFAATLGLLFAKPRAS